MPGDGRLTATGATRARRHTGRSRGTPVPGPTGRGAPGTAPGASGARGAVDACEVKGLLPIRGGPEVARGTAGPGRGPAAGRGTPRLAGTAYRRLGDGRRRRLCGRCHGCTEDIGRWGRPVRRRSCGRRCDATGAATAGGASVARGLSAVRAVAAAFGAAGGAATTAGAGKDSLSLRTTGASIVEEAERTNSPNS